MRGSNRSKRHWAGMMLALALLLSLAVLPDYASSSTRHTAVTAASTHTTGLRTVQHEPAPVQQKAQPTHSAPGQVEPKNHTPEPPGKIAFATDRNDNFEIYVLNGDGGGLVRLTDNPATDVSPSWSPDGMKIAFVSSRDGNPEIYVMNADGSGQTRLTNNPTDDLRPAFSPDGTKIAFVSNRTGNDEIFVMDANGGSQTNLTNSPEADYTPTWRPDGAKLAFTSDRDGNAEIYSMDANGGNQLNLTNNTADDLNPAWSPGKITFQSDRDAASNGNFEVYAMNGADGSSQTRLTNNTAVDADPARSSDGAKIAFVSTRDNNFEIYLMNADGSSQVRLTNDESSDIEPSVLRTLSTTPAASTVQFGAAALSVAEGAGSVAVMVTRTGATTGTTIVDLATVSATASDRTDYTNISRTLRFAPGDTAKTVNVPIINDAFFEESETFIVTLSNPTGATLGAPSTATITITDNDTAPSTVNPIDNATFFVRQQYLDFLNREPDTAGLNAWLSVLNNCTAGNTACDRVAVSLAFFGSPEFQSRGFYVTRFYFAAFARNPTFLEFFGDLGSISGTTPEETNALRADFADNFTNRIEFHSIFDAFNNTQFVDRLSANIGITLTNRDQLLSDLNAGRKTRDQVLQEIVESAQFMTNLPTFNRAFVLAEYFGYLRRNPDQAGFDAWINYLNTHPGDLRTMVNGFVNSTEYRARFGTP